MPAIDMFPTFFRSILTFVKDSRFTLHREARSTRQSAAAAVRARCVDAIVGPNQTGHSQMREDSLSVSLGPGSQPSEVGLGCV